MENPSAADLKAQNKLVVQFCEEFERLKKEQSAKEEELENARRAQKLKNCIEEVEAQQKIKDNANKTLQALSSGNFKLELTDSGKEMKIFVRDYTTGEQRQIEYFNGGEKFLTAVSSAVAIGQPASGQNIANTLIIGEGFGALDDKNRDLMVDELTRLSHILQNGRVIIVSHQEDDDVQKNFANRFRLDKNDEGFIKVQVSL